MVEGANSKRGLANRTSSCGCCGRGCGSRSRHCSLRGCPNAGTYDNLCSPSPSNSHPCSHRHAYAYSYPSADPDAYSYPSADPNTDAHAHADPNCHAHPYARLRRTIPKLGVAIPR